MKSNIVMPQDEMAKAIRQAKKQKRGKASIKELVLQNLRAFLMETKIY